MGESQILSTEKHKLEVRRREMVLKANLIVTDGLRCLLQYNVALLVGARTKGYHAKSLTILVTSLITLKGITSANQIVHDAANSVATPAAVIPNKAILASESF